MAAKPKARAPWRPYERKTGPGYTGQFGGINPMNKATGERRYPRMK
jgi:hypothetical protein